MPAPTRASRGPRQQDKNTQLTPPWVAGLLSLLFNAWYLVLTLVWLPTKSYIRPTTLYTALIGAFLSSSATGITFIVLALGSEQDCQRLSSREPTTCTSNRDFLVAGALACGAAACMLGLTLVRSGIRAMQLERERVSNAKAEREMFQSSGGGRRTRYTVDGSWESCGLPPPARVPGASRLAPLVGVYQAAQQPLRRPNYRTHRTSGPH